MHRFVLLSIDLLLVAAATILALILKDNLEFSPKSFEALLPYLLLTLLAAVPVLLASGLNRTLWRFSSLVDHLRVTVAAVATVVVAVALGFTFNRMEGVARSLPVLQALLLTCALVGARVAMRVRHTMRGRGRRTAPNLAGPQESSVLVVGFSAVTELYLLSVEEFGRERVKVAGLLGRSERHRDRLFRGYAVLGIPEELEIVLAELEVHGVLIDRIVITTTFEQLSPRAREALLQVERTTDIELDFLAERVVRNSGVRAEPSQEDPTSGNDAKAMAPTQIELPTLAPRSYLRWKRVIDVAAATVAVVCLAPVIVLVGIVVVLDIGHPPIFWQLRPGAGGRRFKLFKFRTMANPHDRHGHRLADADRISRVGEFVRRTRLDELPQLYNILVGEMSLVGPRPLLPADQSSAFAARLAVRPGLTGWAQIKGGRELTAFDKAALDIWYVKNASLRLDLRILLGTVHMILFGDRTNGSAIAQAWRELGLDRLRIEAASRLKAVDAIHCHSVRDTTPKFEGVARLTARQGLGTAGPERIRA